MFFSYFDSKLSLLLDLVSSVNARFTICAGCLIFPSCKCRWATRDWICSFHPAIGNWQESNAHFLAYVVVLVARRSVRKHSGTDVCTCVPLLPSPACSPLVLFRRKRRSRNCKTDSSTRRKNWSTPSRNSRMPRRSTKECPVSTAIPTRGANSSNALSRVCKIRSNEKVSHLVLPPPFAGLIRYVACMRVCIYIDKRSGRMRWPLFRNMCRKPFKIFMLPRSLVFFLRTRFR